MEIALIVVIIAQVIKPQQKLIDKFQEMKNGNIPEAEDLLNNFKTAKTIKPTL